MIDIPIPTVPASMEKVLEMMREQKTFLNIEPNMDSLQYWICFGVKCLFAGYGTKYLVSPYVTMAFVIGTLINMCINLTFSLGLPSTILFGAAILKILNDCDRNSHLPTLCWIVYCIPIECEFYMDIYIILCVLGLIFKMYGRDYHIAVAFVTSVICFNWMVDNEEIYINGNILYILGNYVFLFFLLMPYNDNWEYKFERRWFYYFLNVLTSLALILKYYTIAFRKGYIEGPMDFFHMGFDKATSRKQEPVLTNIYEIFENFWKLPLALFKPETTVEEIIVNLNSSSSVEDMPTLNM